MKRLFPLLVALILMLTAFPALAEDAAASTQGVAGSDVHALLSALEGFGISTPDPQTADGKTVWTSSREDVGGVTCSYSIAANADDQLISATFSMQEADNGLFGVVAAMGYDAANPDVAASFIRSGLKKETAMTIGDARFSLKPQTSTSISSISIGGWSKSSTSTSTTYTLRVEHTDEPGGEITLVRLNHDAKLREADNGNSKYHGSAKKGEELMVITPFYSEQWHQIIYNGEVYFVFAEYCEFISE